VAFLDEPTRLLVVAVSQRDHRQRQRLAGDAGSRRNRPRARTDLTIDARVVVASIDTYLRFAEACNRLDLTGGRQPVGLPAIVGQITENSAERKISGAITGASRAIADTIQNIVTPVGRDSD
jgi:hypothetical protein